VENGALRAETDGFGRSNATRERRRDDVQMLTAIDVVVAKIDEGNEGGATISS
jgi:hypothetical protein